MVHRCQNCGHEIRWSDAQPHARGLHNGHRRARLRDRAAERRAQVEDTPASWNTGSSLADRVHVLTSEEWAKL